MQHEEEGGHGAKRFERAEEEVSAGEQAAGEQAFGSRPWPTLHDVGRRFFGTQGKGRQHVGAEIDGENLDHGQRQRDAEQHEGEVGNQLGDVRGQDVGDEFADVFIDRPAFLDGVDDGTEMVVEQHDVGRLARHVGAGEAHGDADVGHAQGRGVVHAITRNGDDLALGLQGLDDDHFLLGGDPGEDHLGCIEGNLQAGGAHLADLVAGHDAWRCAADHIDFAANRQRRARMVAGAHDDAQAGRMAAAHRLMNIRPGRVFEADQAAQGHALFVRRLVGGQRLPGAGNDAQATAGQVFVGLPKVVAGIGIERFEGIAGQPGRA